MPINLDQTGPAHLLSTDEDGLILNGSPVISKSIHVSNTQPRDYLGNIATKMLWLDTGTTGISAFPNGGAANWILRTDGNGTVSWVPPAVLDATKFHYRVSTSTFSSDPSSGNIRFISRSASTMSTATKIIISANTIAGDPNYIVNGVYPPGVPNYNNIGNFLYSLGEYGNSNRRGYIKIEKENDSNYFQIFEFSQIINNTTWFEITVNNIVVQSGKEDFPNNEPVSINFSVAGPQAVTQDLSSYITQTSTENLSLKTLIKPKIDQPFIYNTTYTLSGIDIDINGVINCNSFNLSNVQIQANGIFNCASDNFALNDRIYISGTNTGGGSITGYNSGTIYYIIATNSTTNFTLSETEGGPPISTSSGIPVSLTFTKVIFNIHDAVKVYGTNNGSGSLESYTNTGTIYYIISTNGFNQFTLSKQLNGSALVSTDGTPSSSMIFVTNVGSTISFEDSYLDNLYETRLSVVNSSNDNKIILPDATTTLVGNNNNQTLSNKTLINPTINDAIVNLTNNTSGVIFNGTASDNFKMRLNSTDASNYTISTNLSYNGVTWIKDNAARAGWLVNKRVDDTDNLNSQIKISYMEHDANALVDKLTLKGNGQVILSSNVPSTNTSSGTLVVSGGVGITGNTHIGGTIDIFGSVTAGSIQGTPVGSSSRSTGAFTTLASSSNFSVSLVTESTSTSTGAAVITGGLGVGKSINVKGPIWVNDLVATETKLTDYSMVLQGNTAKLRVGPNFPTPKDYIDLITQLDNPLITTSANNFTIENTKALGNITLSTDLSVIVTGLDEATNKITGSIQTSGGIGVAKNIHANDIYVHGQNGLASASQVVSLEATQNLTNKTLTGATLTNSVMSGTITIDSSTGLSGQLLSSTGTGISWVNPVSNSANVFVKSGDQNFFSSGIVLLPANPSISIGSSFGTMDAGGSGVFTFSVAGTYQIIINYTVSDLNDGSIYPSVDFYVRRTPSGGSVSTVRYCQVLTNSSRKGSVTEYISFGVGDTMDWYIDSSLRVNGASISGSRLTIIRVG